MTSFAPAKLWANLSKARENCSFWLCYLVAVTGVGLRASTSSTTPDALDGPVVARRVAVSLARRRWDERLFRGAFRLDQRSLRSWRFTMTRIDCFRLLCSARTSSITPDIRRGECSPRPAATRASSSSISGSLDDLFRRSLLRSWNMLSGRRGARWACWSRADRRGSSQSVCGMTRFWCKNEDGLR